MQLQVRLSVCLLIQWMMLAGVSHAQCDDPAWVVRYNGIGNDSDAASAIAVDAAGNVYVTGYSNIDYVDYATIKYSSGGVMLWLAGYNGPGDYEDRANAIAVDGAGNVYVTGYSDGGGGNEDYATIKYNSAGVRQWVARYNGTGNWTDRASAIAVDGAGNVYVTGYSTGSGTDHDFATIKYSSTGTEEWVARYDGPGSNTDAAMAIAVDGAGNVFVTGLSGILGQTEFATVRYNSSGTEEWVSRYGGPGNEADYPTDILLHQSGSILVTGGGYMCSESLTDYVTIMYGDDGDTQWIARYNGPGSSYDFASAIASDGAGNIYVTGESADNYATIRYDSSGVQQWVARYNGAGNPFNAAEDIAISGDTMICVTGTSGQGLLSSNNYCTIAYDDDGDTRWLALYDGPGNGDDEAAAIAVDGNGNVFVTGTSMGSGTGYDYATIKYGLETGVTEDVEPAFWLRTNPNPAGECVYVDIAIPEPLHCSALVYSLDGRLIDTLHTGTLPGGEHTFIWQASSQPSGVYLVRLAAGSLEAASRIVLLR